MINESKEEVEYLMGKFYEYRILAAEAGANGADQEYEDFSKQAMDYYERAIAEMDKDAADMTDHLSDEDKALPNKPMNERFEKLAGINESNLSLIQVNPNRTLELIQMYIDNVSDGGMSAEAAVEKIDDILSGSEEMDGYDIAFLKGEEDQY